MAAKDLVIHFYSSSFRGSITQGKNITNLIRSRSGLQDLKLCEELHTSVTSSLLQSILLRGEERVRTVSERSFEDFGVFYDTTVYTEKWGTRFIRGFADKIECESLNTKNSFMIGKTLYGATEEYKSVNTIDNVKSGMNQKDLQHFFDTSEQVPSKFYSQSSGWSNESTESAGLAYLIQLLPGVEKNYLIELDASIKNSGIFEALHSEGLSEKNFQKVFEGVKEEIGYRVAEYEFGCNCRKEAMLEFVKKLDIMQLAEMKQNTQVVICSHCNEKYEITPKELDPYLIAK